MKQFNVTVNGTTYDVVVDEVKAAAAPAPAAAAPAPAAAPKAAAAPAPKAAPAPAAKPAAPVAAGAETVKCPMPGKILSVAVTAGQAVKKGEVLCVLEAMKMQNEIYAPHDATVTDVRVAANQTVSTGEDLIVLG